MTERKKRSIGIKVGDTYSTTNYGDALVLSVESYKKVFVRFLETGNEQFVAGGSLVIGQVVDRKLFTDAKLIYIGKVFSTKNYGDVEVIGNNGQKVTVRFLNTDNVQVVDAGNLRAGLIKDKALSEEICEYKVGSIHKTKTSGEVKVVEIINSHNLVVQFINTGNIRTVSGGNLKKGNVSDIEYFEEMYPYKVGDVFESNNYGSFTIVEFENNKKHRVSVRFHNTGALVKTTISQIACGTVKDPDSKVFVPKELGENRFCVYLHKDSEGIVRYVGQGLVKRALAILGRNIQWNETFKNTPPVVEYVKKGISKSEAESLELELIDKYSETIVNRVRAYSGPREMDYEYFNKFFYVSEESVSGLKWKIDYRCNKAGDDVVCRMNKGYYLAYVNKVNFLVHRIVWLLSFGEISKDMVVDHKNRIRGDNRLQNLTLVNMSHNMRNRMLPLPKSGYRNIRMDISNTGIIRFTVNYTKPLHDSRDKISFSTKTYSCPFEAFIKAYEYRDALISEGVLLGIIKQGERPIDEMKEYLISINKEVL